MLDIRKPLFDLLNKLGIDHATHEHEAIFTVEQGAHIKAKLPGGHTKNLFLKDKSGALFWSAPWAKQKYKSTSFTSI